MSEPQVYYRSEHPARLPGITVTGADERTPIDELLRLTRLSPTVEIGLLYTETPEGRNRYPRREWLEEATEVLGARCAVHVCGSQAREPALFGPAWIRRAGRVQLNGWYAPKELRLALACYPEVIVQHNPESRPDYTRDEYVDPDGNFQRLDRLALLVDASGGRGISPKRWERPNTRKPVGFAGGLGPDNLAKELPRIAAVARDPWWVDMEGKLRDESDWFAVGLAEKAICAFLEWAEVSTEAPANA